jgi:hypothetical protein
MKAKLGYYILEPCIEIWRFLLRILVEFWLLKNLIWKPLDFSRFIFYYYYFYFIILFIHWHKLKNLHCQKESSEPCIEIWRFLLRILVEFWLLKNLIWKPLDFMYQVYFILFLLFYYFINSLAQMNKSSLPKGKQFLIFSI